MDEVRPIRWLQHHRPLKALFDFFAHQFKKIQIFGKENQDNFTTMRPKRVYWGRVWQHEEAINMLGHFALLNKLNFKLPNLFWTRGCERLSFRYDMALTVNNLYHVKVNFPYHQFQSNSWMTFKRGKTFWIIYETTFLACSDELGLYARPVVLSVWMLLLRWL